MNLKKHRQNNSNVHKNYSWVHIVPMYTCTHVPKHSYVPKCTHVPIRARASRLHVQVHVQEQKNTMYLYFCTSTRTVVLQHVLLLSILGTWVHGYGCLGTWVHLGTYGCLGT
jgi:hypothetical protein